MDKARADYHTWVREMVADASATSIMKVTESAISESKLRLNIVVDVNELNPTERIPGTEGD